MNKTILSTLFLNIFTPKKTRNFILPVLLFFTTHFFAQGTSCATAESISINGACDSGTITDTTQDAPLIGTCAGTFNREGWYTFTVTGGPINVTITGVGNNRNIYLQLLSSTSSCTGLTQINCANATTTNGTQTETISATLTNGIYYIKVVNVGSNGNLTLTSLCVTAPIPPSNSTCATATSLPCGATNLAGTTVNTTGATANGTGCSMSDYGVWYSFVGDGQQTTITTNPAFDIKLSVVTGSACGSFSNIVCTDTSPESATFITTNGTTYYVYIAHWLAGSTTTGTFTISRSCTPAPATPVNDECINAIPLTVNTTCSYANYTNANATASTGIPAPGCAFYSGGDVWFSAVVPPTGILNVDMQSGGITDSGLAFYRGSCGSLTLLECDDDDSANGAMSYISMTTLIPGETIYIRVWEYGNDGNGTFGICASAPSCVSPTLNAASNITLTTATISWNAPTSIPSNGYQYVVSTSNTTPGGAGTPTGLTSVNLTGLIANTTYYVFVRSDCGGSNYSAWTPYIVFTTGYCPSTSTSSTYYIANFSTAGGTTNITNNGSGYSAGGYGNFTGMVVTQQNNGTINFTTNFFDGFYTYGFNIWVDWNNDLDFDDAGEKVYASGGYVTGATGSFVVPSGASAGNHRMRIVANYLSTNPTSCGSISSGETEDYTVNVTAAACPGIPTAVTISAITQTSATVNWTASTPAPANGYQYIVTTNPATPNSSTPPTGSTAAGVTTVNLTGLSPDTVYYVYVRNNCNGVDFSPWTVVVSFITGYCSSTSSSSFYYINNFSTSGGSNNIANNGSGYSPSGYGNFTGQTVSQINSASVTFSAVFYDGFYSYGFNIWIDWNNDLDFNDAGELVYASGAYVTSASGTITVPAGASLGNHRMRIVANYLSTNPTACGSISSGETEDYTFTVLPPLPCSGNPSSISAFISSQTTATISWIEPGTPPANGYQYYLSTSNLTPSSSAIATGSVGAGVTSVNLTGLTGGTTYYIWVRSNCGGGLGQGVWIGPISFTTPNCSLGSGTGTTTLGCPGVIAGGLSLSGADPSPVNACLSSSCVDLEATYTPIFQSTSYNVQSIPYSPPYQFNCLRNPVSINVDDIWSTTINLPFQFCFYGNNYTQCLIGSNGVLTFDLTNNTPGGYNPWSFASNLPNASLFRNTIFGVYHDIDPSVGGEVGWELITLNTGCRALVAAWDDIPMFSSSCNSILYSGMMVLYENTNVIEVYVQEKNVCSSWNGGNAIIGIQNGNGTQAVVPPNRNGLDPDWTVTNEAWRFVPSGAPATTVTWHEGSGIFGPVVGTGDVITVCPASTTTYTAEVTYTICSGRTITETDEATVTVVGNKTWNGSVDSDWNKNNNWTPSGIPTGLDCVMIPVTPNNPIVSGSSYVGLAGTLTVLNGATLTVLSGNSVTVTNQVTVLPSGTFNINDNASLVQINNPGIANSGNITMYRNTDIKLYDYVYWSSPVTSFASSAIFPTTSTGLIWKWNPTHNGTDYGIWVNGNENMTVGRGYIVRAPNTATGTPTSHQVTFTGVPNNGNLTTPISRGTRTSSYPSPGGTATAEDDNWNLIGNPYPSAIDANTFISSNLNIDGTIRLWTHGLSISAAYVDPFYGDYTYNYSINDYITYNSLGSTPPGFMGKIGAGQAFFVQMNHSAPTPSTVVFNNGMRNGLYDNSQFYRTSMMDSDSDKNRIWLTIENAANETATSLVGYAVGASLEKDRNFDSTHKPGNAVGIYSMIEKPMIIQGRPMPFDQNDQVTIGVTTPTAGNYSIGILTADGLFADSSQNIYLEDTLLNIDHDLRQEPYSFSSESGNFENRFILKYVSATLGNSEFNANTVNVATNTNINIHSSNELLDSIIVYDILGRKLAEYKNVNATEFIIKNLMKNDTTLVLKIKTESGAITHKKIIY
ncbi:GEVED domain-containing protein [Flavobacterium sp.]|uniref:GEVED domain-containing protein n=1 Tax=Flavobacterium sp. TaxID=239 RepID=UPI002B4AF0B3|nr:GEVED domain-containing protein [Flavobacterium sp.]HLP64487.1 GEVED domain-containing protein [Flavobacterium sp.]